MQAILAKLAQLLGPIFLNFVIEKIAAWRARLADRKKREAEAKAVREQTEEAVTPGEREDALKNELRNS